MKNIQKLLEEFRKPELIKDHFSDALDHTTTMSSRIKPVFQGVKMAGTAITVKTPPGIMRKVFDALTIAGRGNVIVVNAGGDEEYAHWGGCVSFHAQRKGIEGIVVDGGIRDVVEIRKLRFPVFAKSVCQRLGGIGKGIGGALVRPGDIIVGDGDGVVAVPPERAKEALRKAKAHAKFDEKEKKRFAEGKEIWDIFAEFDYDYSKMYEWAEKP